MSIAAAARWSLSVRGIGRGRWCVIEAVSRTRSAPSSQEPYVAASVRLYRRSASSDAQRSAARISLS